MRDREVFFADERARVERVRKIAMDNHIETPPVSHIRQKALPPVSHNEAFDLAVMSWLFGRERAAADMFRGRPPIDRSQWVYFVRGGDRIKIGYAANTGRRIADLQTASPVPLELLTAIPGSRDLERELHRQFAALRTHGEWFRAEDPLLSHVDRLRERQLRRARPPVRP